MPSAESFASLAPLPDLGTSEPRLNAWYNLRQKYDERTSGMRHTQGTPHFDSGDLGFALSLPT